MHGAPILEVEEMRSGAKNVSFMFALEPETLSQVQAADTHFETRELNLFGFAAVGQFHGLLLSVVQADKSWNRRNGASDARESEIMQRRLSALGVHEARQIDLSAQSVDVFGA
jgi:hypothetical protein